MTLEMLTYEISENGRKELILDVLETPQEVIVGLFFMPFERDDAINIYTASNWSLASLKFI